MRMDLDAITARCNQGAPRRLAVAAAGDEAVLLAVYAAFQKGLVQPILCGDIEQIDRTARLHNINISQFEIIEADRNDQAISIAVSLVREGRADILMKGLVQTPDLLRAVLHKESGLETTGVLSHVAAIDCPQIDRTLLLTDCAICMYPDLKTKVQIVKNAVTVAHGLGIQVPYVAPLAALEIVNPNMPATLDAAALTMMNRRGQLTGCHIDGPMALDVALSTEAAAHKGVASEAAGNADILLFHSIEAGNSTYKALTVVGGCLAGGVVMGASVPIVLTSRSDSSDSKLLSIALACSSKL